ncbi:hypothetical protein ACVNRM_27775 [Bacillus paranthracis]|uniref:hypothetical protein n=1 Tax=Bacteria TaxID=2 RepID=UPI000771907F|nr:MULTISPECIES: hypothetical protein [Bacillus]KXI55338.1 hypothetical protein ACS45_02190 [Bacillus cereus]RXC11515.1 hypothetical protein EPS84_24010 [Escherichia coli]KAB7630660.1 hypothetical protein GBN96_28225 [Bacillus sp. B4-WWTP-NA-D-NA-NA]KAB7633919.1 hypothetical protein GBN83_27575 [Bacillus sp. B3-WWTP-C-10-D-3]MDA1829680.1 hypothetical protein [Bacillus cereus group sp. BY25LC]
MEKQLYVQENSLSYEVEQSCRQFVDFGLSKGLSNEEAFQLIDTALELVSQGRGDEWINIAQNAIDRVSNKNI